MNNITEPLNDNIINYYSVLFDGASSAKCIDEKELFMTKTCVEGSPTFNVMSLEEPEECTAAGIKEAMENSISKMKFNFPRKQKEIGMCSDGAAVNNAVYDLLVPEFGDHYLGVFCPSHKFELGINDAFVLSILNNTTEKDYTDIYYFFQEVTITLASSETAKYFHGNSIQKV